MAHVPAPENTTRSTQEPVATSTVRLWSREFVLAWIVNFFLAFVFYFLMTTMAVYAIKEFIAGETASGLAASMFVIGSTTARLFAGNLVELVGRRRNLLIALVVGALASLAYFPASSYGSLLVVRFLHGASFAIASTTAMTLAQSVIPRARRGEGTGYFTLSMTLATALGPLLGLLLVDHVGYGALFAGSAVASVLALVIALFLRTRDLAPDREARARLLRFRPADMLHPAVLPVASFMLVLAICYSGVLTYLQPFAAEAGLAGGASIFFLVYAASMLLTRTIMGRLQDRRGDNAVIVFAVLAFAAGLALLGLAGSDALVIVAGVAMGLGFGSLLGALQAVAVSKVPMRRVGVAISTHYFMVDLGIGIGPVLLGLGLGVFGFDTMYLVLAVVALVSLGLYELVHGRYERARRRVRAEDGEGAAAADSDLVRH
ncbi:MFS transporter [Occultella kanbiaonis]|uniref:MFS transporter n=1 Tax=Occultella kanbiaonis TaxID=2675754 RepID=UPI001B357A4B|nr:MFS transporter [Occultella kanbiaonis]